jgi:hypothetical protein
MLLLKEVAKKERAAYVMSFQVCRKYVFTNYCATFTVH